LMVVMTAQVGGPRLGQLLESLQRAEAVPKTAGPSVPWPTMVALAEENKHKIHKDAVLDDVSAEPVGSFEGITYTNPTTGSLEVTFEYDAPSTLFAWVRFEDAGPASTLSHTRYPYEDKLNGESSFEWSKSREPELRKAVGKVKLTPRDALALTWSDATRYAPRLGNKVEQMRPSIRLNYLDKEDPKPFWAVVYWPAGGKPKMEKPGDLGGIFGNLDAVTSKWMLFEIDAQTGKILTLEVGNEEIIPRSTPTP
jgi:hypothetical protein